MDAISESKFDLPFQIFRLSGIYSNQYNILKRLKLGEAKIINKKNHFFSRIHVEDIANILFRSLNNLKKMKFIIFQTINQHPQKKSRCMVLNY